MLRSGYRFTRVMTSLASIVLLAACSSASTPAPPSAAAGTPGALAASPAGSSAPASSSATPRLLVESVDVGGLGDKGFNDGVKYGIDKAAQEFGAQEQFLKATKPEDYVTNLTSACEQGADVIAAVGYLQTDALTQVATAHPECHFVGIDIAFGNDKHLPNVREVQFREQQASFLLGVLAGQLTTAGTSPLLNSQNIIGAVPGVKIPSVDRWVAGYVAGAKTVDPSVTALVTYTGTFQDIAKAKETALQEYNQGADMVFEILGATGAGVFEAAKETNHIAFSTDLDKAFLDPQHIMTSATKDVTLATYQAAADLYNGKWTSGIFYYDMTNNGVGLAPFHNFDSIVPQAIKDKIAKAQDLMKSGQLQPPTKPEDVDSWIAANKAQLQQWGLMPTN